MQQLFSFPDPVNETSARLVAGSVVILTIAFLTTQATWLLWVLAYGFVARVLTGPTLSPLGLLATRVITPRLDLDHQLVPGPPKRFAQGIGALLSVGALVAQQGFGASELAFALVAAITFAASLEAVVGYCLGCSVFNGLMRIGLIPDSVCQACAQTRAALGPLEPKTIGRAGG